MHDTAIEPVRTSGPTQPQAADFSKIICDLGAHAVAWTLVDAAAGGAVAYDVGVRARRCCLRTADWRSVPRTTRRHCGAVTQVPSESSHRTRSIAAMTAGSSGLSPSARRAWRSSSSTLCLDARPGHNGSRLGYLLRCIGSLGTRCTVMALPRPTPYAPRTQPFSPCRGSDP
jgi:hypothetical protein